ncbi:MAG: AAC(3) family N-acetyltransferase [Anaerolineae bacterium]|nr:AAC(3) family N-acetyltransferase [Anaerolineae bacterium]
MAQDLLGLGLRPGGVALVHSSLSSLGRVPGGPETVLRGLLEALGPAGTLLLPALSYEHVGPHQPVFHVQHTPSNVGAIPEHFRRRPGTRRSLHPTHSVCGVGPLVDHLLGEHHLGDTPCGSCSPFRKLRDAGGQILFLGCGLRPNTSMHGVEELVEPPYLFGERVAYRVIGLDGGEITVWSRRHNHGPCGVRQRYDRIEGLLEPGRELRAGKVLQARAHLLECGAMWREGVGALRRDPLYLVEPE